MNKKKIKSMLVMMGTVLSLNMGSQIEVKALDIDKSKPSLESKENAKAADSAKKTEKSVTIVEEEYQEAKANAYTRPSTSTVSQADIDASLERINAGKGTFKDYKTNLKISRIDDYMIDTFNKAVLIRKNEKGSNLEKEEVVDLVDEVRYVCKLNLSVEEENPDFDIFVSLDINSVDEENYLDVFEALLANRKSFIFQSEVQEFTDKIFAKEDAIGSGNAVIEDYQFLGLSEVTEDMVSMLNPSMRSAAINKGSRLNLVEIREVIDKEKEKIQAVSRMNTGEATLADFQMLEIRAVDENNLETVKGALKGKNCKTIEEIQKVVDEENGRLEVLKTVCYGNGTAQDFNFLGLTQVTEANIGFVNDEIKKHNYTTFNEVKQAVEDTIYNLVNKKLASISAGTAGLNDYLAIGLSEVNEENVNFINENIKGKTYRNINEVKEAVTNAITLFNAVKNINDGKASLDDYKLLGQEADVTSSNLQFMNDNMKGSYDYTLDGVKANIRSVLNLYSYYVKINRGEASTSDYTNIGIENISKEILKDVNEKLKGKNIFVRYEIQSVVNDVIKLTESIERINKGNAQVYDYIYLGTNLVNKDNLSFINEIIKGQSLSNREEVVNAVADKFAVYEAVLRIKDGNGDLSDYAEKAAVTSVNDSNIRFVNERMKKCTAKTYAGIKESIELAVKTYNAIQNINNGIATVDEYRLAGASTVTSENYEYLNKALQGGRLATVEEVQAAVKELLSLETSKDAINSGIAAVSDYEKLGITGVTEKNKLFVNEYVRGHNFQDKLQIQTAVNSAVEIYELIININSGNGTPDDFAKIGAKGVTDKNYHYVISFCKNYPEVDLQRFCQNVDKGVSRYNSLVKVNAGGAELTDYKDILDMTGVERGNLNYINYYRKTQGYFFDIDAEDVNEAAISQELQTMINKARNSRSVYATINSGLAEVSTYNSLGIANVNEDNLDFVNSYLRGLGLVETEDVRKAVDNAVADFEAIERIDAGKGSIEDYRLIIGKKVSIDPETGKEVEEDYVTVDNINFINPRIKDNGYNTPAKILDFVKVYIERFKAVGRIKDGKALLSDYNVTFKVNGVNDSNLAFVNASLAGVEYNSVQEIQNAINIALENYAAILRINEGHADTGDYELLGIKTIDNKTIVTEKNINFINLLLKNSNNFTITEVKNAVNIACQKYRYLEKIKSGQANINDYVALGISIVNNSNINYINENIKGRNYETIELLDADANIFAKNYEILVRIDDGFGTVEDYTRLGVSGITEANVEYVNNDLNHKGYYKNGVKAVSNTVEAGNHSVNCYNIINKVNASEAKLLDYDYIKVDRVTSNNIQFINANIKGLNYKTIAEIQSKVNELASKFVSFDLINSGRAVANDYANIDVKIPDASLVTYINQDLKDKNILTTKDMQEVVDKNSNIYLALKNINSGDAVLSDFKSIGCVSVTDDKLDFLNVKLKGKNLLKASDAKKKVELLLAQSGCYGRIFSGTASLEDYQTVEVIGVTEHNIEYINHEIKGNIDLIYGSNIQSQVTAILKLFNAVDSVNEGKESKDSNNYVREYQDICDAKVVFDNRDNSIMRLIKRCVEIDRKILNDRALTKKEISDIISQVMSYYEDAKVVLNKIDDKLTASKESLGRDTTGDEDKTIITDLRNNMKQVVSRVKAGKASVEDYIFLGENQMTAVLASIVNSDIEKYHTVVSDSEYRINPASLKEAIKKGNAILNINAGNATEAGEEFATIGYRFDYRYDTERIELVKKAIEIERAQKDGVYLKREEILNVIKDVTKYEKDVKSLMPAMESAIEAAKSKNGGALTGENVKKVKEEVIRKRKEAVSRILSALGTVDDFKYFGQNSVTEDNLAIINTDIDQHKTIKKITEYRIEGLEEAVKKGIAIYEINNPKGEINVNNFRTIGIEVESSQDELSRYRLIEKSIELERRKSDQAFLTRSDIIEIVNNVDKEFEDKKVIIPKINDAIIQKERDGSVLDAKGVTEVINTVENEIRNICKRIVQGEATVEDYKALGKNKVNEDNIKIINADVKENSTITPVGAYRLNGLDLGVEQGLAVYYVNYNYDKEAADQLAKINMNLEYGNEYNTEFKLLESYIKLQRTLEGGRCLTRKEIANILSMIREDFLDMQLLMPKIDEKLNAEERKKGSALTSDEAKEVLNSVKTKLKEVCSRVVKGQGSLDDFKYLGKSKVTDDNLNVINRDISYFKNVAQESSYRLRGLDEAINVGNAIYSINKNSDESVAKDFNLIGLKLPYSNSEISQFKLVCSQVRIQRLLKDGEFLERQDIINIANKIANDYYDQSVIIPRVITEIDKIQRETKVDPNKEKTAEVKKNVENNIKEVCKRIVSGDGTVEDFNYLGESRVNDDNINIINRDIKTYKNISLLSNYRVDGLTKAVTQGLAVYEINSNNDQTVSKAYSDLDKTIDYSTAENSMFNLVHLQIEIQKAVKEGGFLTRKEILDIIDNFDSKKEDLKVTVPAIYEALEKAKKENGDNVLSTEKANEIIQKVQNDIKDICTRVSKGEGLLEDYRYLGETRVNESNIKVINTDIKEFGKVSLITSYRLSGLNDAVIDGLAVYKINNDYDETLTEAFKRLKMNVSYSSAEGTKCSLLKAMMDLKSRVKMGEAVTRGEILDIISDIDNNTEDLQVIIPKVTESIKLKEEAGSTKILGDACEAEEKAVKDNIRQICSRIVSGNGGLEDFKYLGQTKVTKDNIEVVNKDIKNYGNISLITSYRVSGLEDAVKAGLAVYKINTDYDRTVVGAFKTLGVNDIEYSNDEKSMFAIINSKIKLNTSINDGQPLERGEILNIISEVKANIDDLRVTLPKINELVASKEAEKGAKIYGSEVENVIKEAENFISAICSKVVKGEGHVEDFKYLGETRVTSENIAIINADIKTAKKASLLTSFRIKDLDTAVSEGLAIYKINNNSDSTVENAFKVLGCDAPYSTDEKSMFVLIKSKIKVMRGLKNGAPLTRNEILDIISEVSTNEDDLKVIMPKVNERITALEAEKGEALTSEETQAVRTEVENFIKDVCLKITKGQGTVENFKYLGETRVNEENIKIINDDIKSSRSISAITAFRLDGLSDAVSKGLAVYKINKNNDKTIASEFGILGEDIPYSTEDKSIFNLVCSKIKLEKILKGADYLNREDILEIVKNVKENADDLGVIIPKVIEDLKGDYSITSDELKALISKTENQVKDIVTRVSEGKGTVDDFEALKELRVNEFNIDVVNEDISRCKDISKLSVYRLEGLKEAVDAGLAIYNININESMASDFETIGINVTDGDGDKENLVESQVKLNRLLAGGRTLNRDEIKNAVEEVNREYEDKKVLLPAIEAEINKLEGTLGVDETEKLIEKVKENVAKICKRVLEGAGTYYDYVFLGDSRVTTKNYQDINTDILSTRSVTKLSSYRLAGLAEAVTNGIALNEINEGIDRNDSSNFALMGVKLDYSSKDTSLYQITKSAIDIQRRIKTKHLTRGEIIEIAKNIAAEFDDALVIIPAVNHAINDAEKEADKPLDGAEVADLESKIKNDIRQVIERIVTGKATVEDYNYIGERRINDRNIEIANTEVSEYRNITKASNYRLNDMEPAMKVILDIMNINEGTLTFNHDTVKVRLGNSDIIRTIETNFRVKEFEDFGEIVEKDYSTNSELTLIKKAIQVMKLTKGGKPLTRREIIYSVIKEVKRNPEDAAIMLPRMYHRLNDEQTSKNALLTSEEATKYMTDEKNKVKEAAMRVFVGRGTVDDYKIFGCHNVNKDNVVAINNDINEFRTIRKLSDFRLEGVEDAVSLGLAIYNINTKNVSKTANEYALLGRDVEYSDVKTSRFKLIEGQIAIEREKDNSKLLTRGEIISCIDEVTNNIEDKKILIPAITDAIDEYKACYGTIDSEVVENKITSIEEDRKALIRRVFYGKGTVKDYIALGENRVNKYNKDTVNAHIYKKLVKLSEYRLAGLEDEVTKGIAVYNINNNLVVEGSNNNAKEFADLGLQIKFSNVKDSDFRVLENYIIINKRLNDNKDLDAETIADLYDDVMKNIESYRKIIPMVYDELQQSEEEGTTMNPESLQTLMDNKEEALNKTIDRIISGNADLADYKLFGETRVTLVNKAIVNDYIKENRGIRKTGKFSIRGLEDAVTKGLAVYNLNKGMENKTEDGLVTELKTLGIDVVRSDETLSEDWLVMTYIKILQKTLPEGEAVSKKQIVDITNEIKADMPKAKLFLQKAIHEIETREIAEDVTLNPEEVEGILKRAKEEANTGSSTEDSGDSEGSLL